MKIRLLLFALTCGLVAMPAVRAQDKDEQTELGEHMEKIGGAFRALRKQIADPAKNEDSLKRISVIRDNAMAALKLEPSKKADVPAGEQAKFVADYQAKMKGFLGDVDKLESALKANNNEEAAKLLQALGQDQKDGHHDFQKKKQKM